MSVGVVAVQGDFDKHVESLVRAGAKNVVEVRTADDLMGVDRLIIPGGESTTVGLLMKRFGLGQALVARAAEGMPIWGTCMGMILMAKDIEGRPHQYSLGILDICVKRNAFGAQVNSFEDKVSVEGLNEPILGVFIRAPVVSRHEDTVSAIATYNGQIVAVRQGVLIGTSFHPELTRDVRMHEWFMSL